MYHVGFFGLNNLPDEVIKLILSFTGNRDIYREWRALNNRFKNLSELELLADNQAISLPYQKRIIYSLVDPRNAAYISSLDEEHKNEIKACILKFLARDTFDCSDKLHQMAAIFALDGNDQMYSEPDFPILLDELKESFSQEEAYPAKDYNEKLIQKITIVAPFLSSDQLDQCIELLIQNMVIKAPVKVVLQDNAVPNSKILVQLDAARLPNPLAKLANYLFIARHIVESALHNEAAEEIFEEKLCYFSAAMLANLAAYLNATQRLACWQKFSDEFLHSFDQKLILILRKLIPHIESEERKSFQIKLNQIFTGDDQVNKLIIWQMLLGFLPYDSGLTTSLMLFVRSIFNPPEASAGVLYKDLELVLKELLLLIPYLPVEDKLYLLSNLSSMSYDLLLQNESFKGITLLLKDIDAELCDGFVQSLLKCVENDDDDDDLDETFELLIYFNPIITIDDGKKLLDILINKQLENAITAQNAELRLNTLVTVSAFINFADKDKINEMWQLLIRELEHLENLKIFSMNNEEEEVEDLDDSTLVITYSLINFLPFIDAKDHQQFWSRLQGIVEQDQLWDLIIFEKKIAQIFPYIDSRANCKMICNIFVNGMAPGYEFAELASVTFIQFILYQHKEKNMQMLENIFNCLTELKLENKTEDFPEICNSVMLMIKGYVNLANNQLDPSADSDNSMRLA